MTNILFHLVLNFHLSVSKVRQMSFRLVPKPDTSFRNTFRTQLPWTEIKKNGFRIFLVERVWVRSKWYLGSDHQLNLSSGIFNIRRAPCGYHPVCARIRYFGRFHNWPNPGGDLKIWEIFTNLRDMASDSVKVGSSFLFHDFSSKNYFDPRRSWKNIPNSKISILKFLQNIGIF